MRRCKICEGPGVRRCSNCVWELVCECNFVTSVVAWAMFFWRSKAASTGVAALKLEGFR